MSHCYTIFFRDYVFARDISFIFLFGQQLVDLGDGEPVEAKDTPRSGCCMDIPTILLF